MNDKQTAVTYATLKKELHKEILLKISQIRDKIVDEQGPPSQAYIQMLMNINDELDDVLLNWETNELNLTKYSTDFDKLAYSKARYPSDDNEEDDD